VVANDKLLKFWKYSGIINLKKLSMLGKLKTWSLSLDNIFISADLYTSVILYLRNYQYLLIIIVNHFLMRKVFRNATI